MEDFEEMDGQNAPGKWLLTTAGGIGLAFTVFFIIIFIAKGAGGYKGPLVVVSFVYMLFSLFAYIMALANSGKLESGGFLLILGCIMIIVTIINAIMSVMAGIFSFPLNIILDVLFIVGALKNKEAFGKMFAEDDVINMGESRGKSLTAESMAELKAQKAMDEAEGESLVAMSKAELKEQRAIEKAERKLSKL